MKMTKILGTTFASLILFATGATPILAADQLVVNGTKQTPTTVQIIDDLGDPDPLDPSDPTQAHLTLEHVPGAYDFSSTLARNGYKLNATMNDNIQVFNDRSARQWSVKASVLNDQLVRGGDYFNVDQFSINDIALATGTDTVVAKSADKTVANNTGLLTTPVTGVKINFKDPQMQLKAGDKLTGAIKYQLYAVADVE
ncbi:hypothetical protein ACJQWY_05830 [Weissella kandleri]|uniref:hypothetical protein n=1 Tax=Weissella kandleri TaxID=1616 RepID=UPI00387E6B33